MIPRLLFSRVRRPFTAMLVYDGASFGTTVYTQTPYTHVVTAELTPEFPGLAVHNDCVSGHSWTNMELGDGGSDRGLAVNILPRFDGSRQVEILTAWGGTNDMGTYAQHGQTNNKTGEQAWASAQSYFAAARAARPSVVLVGLTTPPRSDAGAGPGSQFEDRRQVYNALMRAGEGVDYDHLCDVAADVRIGAAGASDDLTYYQSDKVHLNDTGQRIVADLLLAVIRPILRKV